MAKKQVNPRLIWTVTILLTLLFGGIGVLLLVNPKQFALHDDQLPYFRGLGASLCVGAVLLLVPRVAWVGALLLAVILLGLIGVSIYQGQMSQTVVPALFLVSVGTLAYIRRPRDSSLEPPKKEPFPVKAPNQPASPPAVASQGGPSVV
jgi:hypothetical protein